uniref:Major facilitator superfamily (MFS) profile domain-containing protein n=2 Tax=Clytia hemisphaerica TaxID=252671 RepID=A0A7M5WZF7_9CNID
MVKTRKIIQAVIMIPKIQKWFRSLRRRDTVIEEIQSSSISSSASQRPSTTPLPKKLLFVLFLLQIFSAMADTMVFSYLPKMVKSFGISEVKTGFYAGWIASAFFLGRIPFSFAWGYISDIKGRRFAAILSSLTMSLATIFFGFSTTFWWALSFRLIQGCLNGLPIICKAIVSAMCDNTNLSNAMTLVLASYNTGIIIGPSLAGFLVFPHDAYPSVFSEDNIFHKYPISMPNFVLAFGLSTSIILGFKFIPLERSSKNNEKNYLLDPIEKRKRYDNVFDTDRSTSEDSIESASSVDEYLTVSMKLGHMCDIGGYFQIIEPKIIHNEDNNIKNGKMKRMSLLEKWKTSKARKCFSNKWCVVCCLLYAIFSVVGIGLSELIPLYLATSRDYGGMALSTREIGVAFLISAALLLILQLTVITWVAKRYGARFLYITGSIAFGLAMPLLPLTGRINNESTMWVVLVLVLVLLLSPMAAGFLAINILVNNTVEEDLLGSANGLAMSMSSIGRMIAPSMVGTLLTWSLHNVEIGTDNQNGADHTNAMGFPFNHYFTFFVLSLIAFTNAIIAFWIPSTLDNRPSKQDFQNDCTCSEDSSGGFEDRKVTDITVSFFNPTLEFDGDDQL